MVGTSYERKLKAANYKFITRLGVMTEDAKRKQHTSTEFSKQIISLYRQKLLLKIQNIVKLLVVYDFTKITILLPNTIKCILIHISQLKKIGVTDLHDQRLFFKHVIDNIYDIHRWYFNKKSI